MSDFLDLQGAKDLNTDAIHIGAVANSKDPVTGEAIDTHVNRAGGTDYTLQGFWGALGPVVMPWTSVAGGTLTQPNQAFLHPANGNYYSWTGAFPKVVSPSTDPTAVSGYVPRADVALRDELSASGGSALVGDLGKTVAERLADSRTFDANLPSSVPVLGAKDPVGVYVEVGNADAAGSMWIFRKAGKAFVAEQLLSGNWSAGDSLPNSCPNWRFGRVHYCEGLAAYKHAYSATNVGGIVPEVTFSSTLFSGGATVFKNGVKMWRFTGAGAYMEFQTSADELSLILGANSDCSAALKIQLYKDGVYIKDLDVVKCNIGYGYDAFLWSAKNPYAGQVVTVRLTATTSATEYVMVGGIDATLNSLKYSSADYIAFHINNDADKIISSATGAQNYAIQEKTTGLFGGESHGGEYVSRRNVRFDDTLMSLVTGTYFVCSRVSIEQRSQVVWKDTPPLINMEIKSQLTLTSEGSQFIGDFLPTNLIATTAYFSMFTYQGTYNRVYHPRYVDTSQVTVPTQIQMPQASGFKAMHPLGRMVECSWSMIYKNNPEYAPYLQRMPQGNPYDKFYYGVAIPPDGGVELEPLRFVTLRKYSL